MNEKLVQWTLMQNLEYLSKILDFQIASKVGQEISTDYGRIDFILENFQNKLLVVELETTLNSKSKRDYCFNQILNYKNISFNRETEYCLLYANETKLDFLPIISKFAEKNNIQLHSYSVEYIKELYAKTINRLSLSFGLSLPKPVNYTICFLRWINKIVKPFKDFNKQILTKEEISSYFKSYNSTNFRCYLQLALDFEMLEKRNENYVITKDGFDYISSFNPEITHTNRLSSVGLTNEQKRILLRIITNGKWTPHKVSIYWFLRFIEVTNGEWVPNFKIFDNSKLELVNSLFGVNYKFRTMFEFLNFVCNWCNELGMVERIKTKTSYDKVYLTPLGVEINNIFSLDLLLKKSRLNLSFKYLD